MTSSETKEKESISVQYLLSVAQKYHQANRLPQAETLYRTVLSAYPNNPFACYWLGLIEEGRKHSQIAFDLFTTAVKHRPNFPEAWHRLGVIASKSGHTEKAFEYYQRAIAEQPKFAPSYNNIGNLLVHRREWDEALAYFWKALHYQPDFAEAHNNIGMVLSQQGKAGEALAAHLKALELNPGYGEIYSNIGAIYRNTGQLDLAEEWFRRSLTKYPQHAKAPTSFSNHLMLMPYMLRYTPAEIKATAMEWYERYGKQYTPFTHPPATAKKRLRIGYISPDFYHHPVGYFLQAPFAHHDPEAVEIFCYSTVAFDDEITQELKKHAEHWLQVEGFSDERLAERIRADGIDILIDLSGHTAKNRLAVFARKPAPVQASWIGFFATTGLPTMDYFIADAHTVPPAEEAQYVEKIARLPDYYLCFTPPNRDIPVAPLPASTGKPFTFGCFNALTKITPDTIRLWSAVLKRLPASILLMKNKVLDDTETQQHFLAQFAAHGIGTERIRFEGQSPFYEMFSAYNHVDIVLDPYPFGGNTITLQGLWMGVPVVTITSPRFVGHMGEGIMRTLGLPEWVATSEADYVEKAVAFASDLPALSALRAKLRPQLLASPLCDGKRFAHGLEQLYREMWETHCNSAS